jgi:ABC-type glutathione transport system ATPase component
MSDSENVSLELRGLSVTYRGKESDVLAVRHCSFLVPKGGVVGLVGESGSGKTSALMAIPRLLPAGTLVEGQIFCDGTELTALDENAINAWRWRRVALVPQGAMNSFTPHLTIERHITEALERHMKMKRRQSKEQAAELLGTVGLGAAFLTRYPHELSGGQKQRAALATALACKPDFLLADEPTTALDVITQKEVLDMIVSLARARGMGLLLVTHDLPLAALICDTLIVMKDGVILENGPSRQVVESPKTPYARQLVDAVRNLDQGGRVVS